MQTETELNSAKRSLDLPLAAWLGVLLLAVIFFGAIRYRLRDMPLERDEGEYAYAGQLLLQGIAPYILAYNMKLPGVYAAYAGVMAALGETTAGIHLGLLLLNAVTSILLFFLTAHLFGRMAGAVAGISYALLSTSASVMGFEAHATHFVVFPALLGILLLLHAARRQRFWLVFLSGLLSGIAFLMKQHAAFFVLFCLLYLGWMRWERKEPLLRQAVAFMAGVILPYIATCWWMYRAGIFKRFWFWTVAYAGEYSRMGLRRAIHAFLENSHIVMSPSISIWILALLGVTAVLWSPGARRQSVFLILFLLCSFLALCPGGYFRPHYYILLLPAVSILVAVAVSSATEKLTQQNKLVAMIPLLVFLACVGFSVFRQRQTYFSLTPDEVVQSIYGNNAFVPVLKVADYIRENSPADARIAVLGSEPEIYFYARRHSATGYMYMYSLIVHHKYTERMRNEMVHELEMNWPLYVVFVDVWDDWGPPEGGPQLAEFLPRLREIINRSYNIVGIADIDESTRYVWDAGAQNYQPHSSKVIYVLRRKSDSLD
jgi:4-amino-4-deoxy-L-arabinose transferase-like glycosyltransferase